MFSEEAQNALYHDYVAVELPVILIDRGNCNFVTKVRNVEKVGANVALIGNDHSMDTKTFVMSDDGSGHTINIPSFMLQKQTADAFKQYLNNGHKVLVKILIETATSDNVVTVDLWYSTEFDLTDQILTGLQKYLPKFGDKVIFNPRIKTKGCPLCLRKEEQKECLSNGRYCPLVPTSDFPAELKEIDGKDLIR